MVAKSCEASEAFQCAAAEAGYLGKLVGELTGPDVLLKLNALEILAGMAAGAPHSARSHFSIALFFPAGDWILDW